MYERFFFSYAIDHAVGGVDRIYLKIIRKNRLAVPGGDENRLRRRFTSYKI